MPHAPTDAAEIRAIVADLQEELRRHRLVLGDLAPALRADPLDGVRQHQWVNSHLPIGWPVMPMGIAAKLSAYAQKIVRRLLRWYIDPIVEQQNAFNTAVVRALESLKATSASVSARITDLEALGGCRAKEHSGAARPGSAGLVETGAGSTSVQAALEHPVARRPED